MFKIFRFYKNFYWNYMHLFSDVAAKQAQRKNLKKVGQ